MLDKRVSYFLPDVLKRPETSRSLRVERLMKGSPSAGRELLQVAAALLLFLMVGAGIVMVPIAVLQLMGLIGL